MKPASRIFQILKQAGRALLLREADPETASGQSPRYAGDHHGTDTSRKRARSSLPGSRNAGRTSAKAAEAGQRHQYRADARHSEFLHGVFESPAGSREYRLFVPSCYAKRPLPLIIMLHGCKQNPEDFAAGTGMNEAAEEAGLLVAYPAQARSANRMGCWNWFQEKHQQRDQGEPAIIAGITREIMQRYAVDARRVYVAGLSAGASMAVIMGNTYPDLYAAVGVHSGLVYRGADSAYSAIFAMQRGARIRPRPPGPKTQQASPALPTIVFHGDSDRTVHPDNGKLVMAYSAPNSLHGVPPGEVEMVVRRGQVNGGHAYTQTAYLNEFRMPVAEHWVVHGSGHAWSGGRLAGSYTDHKGPDATREMLRFLLGHARPSPSRISVQKNARSI
jgi:poly(hydroxyalkanoate) depolymerase family esterase